MRIAIEVEGAEINISAREAAAKEAAQDTSLSLAAGNVADAGAAPHPDMMRGAGFGDDQATAGNTMGAGGQDAGQAPELSAMGTIAGAEATGPSESGDGAAIDAGAAKFTPPGEEDTEQTHG
jgi:hypothetical protein